MSDMAGNTNLLPTGLTTGFFVGTSWYVWYVLVRLVHFLIFLVHLGTSGTFYDFLGTSGTFFDFVGTSWYIWYILSFSWYVLVCLVIPLFLFAPRLAGSSISRDLTWNGTDDFGSKVGKGVYVYKLKVHSKSTGLKSEKIEKLVIL